MNYLKIQNGRHLGHFLPHYFFDIRNNAVKALIFFIPEGGLRSPMKLWSALFMQQNWILEPALYKIEQLLPPPSAFNKSVTARYRAFHLLPWILGPFKYYVTFCWAIFAPPRPRWLIFVYRTLLETHTTLFSSCRLKMEKIYDLKETSKII